MTIETKEILSSISSEDLRSELENRGTFTRNLWSILDVRGVIEDQLEQGNDYSHLTDDECMDVLNSVLTGEGHYSYVWEVIPMILSLNYGK